MPEWIGPLAGFVPPAAKKERAFRPPATLTGIRLGAVNSAT
jgi:hypothetical protein